MNSVQSGQHRHKKLPNLETQPFHKHLQLDKAAHRGAQNIPAAAQRSLSREKIGRDC